MRAENPLVISAPEQYIVTSFASFISLWVYMLNELRRSVANGQYNVTSHADKELVKDELLFNDVQVALMNGEIIEDYPNDFPFPSCLIFGKSNKGDSIHAVWAYDGIKDIAILITAYRPDPLRWFDLKIRRK